MQPIAKPSNAASSKPNSARSKDIITPATLWRTDLAENGCGSCSSVAISFKLHLSEVHQTKPHSTSASTISVSNSLPIS